MRESNDRYRKGDWWITDDRTGARIRSSEAKREWDGTIVHEDDWEARQPQDFVRSRADRQTVSPTRPVPPPTYGGAKETTLSADAAAGDTQITVASTADFSASDQIAVMTDRNERHLTTVSSVDDATTMTLAAALPAAASSGLKVINYSNVATANIG